MKKLSIIALILLVSVSGIEAQKASTKIRHKIENNVPVEVLAAIDMHTPGLNLQQHLAEPAPNLKTEKKTRKIKRNPPPPTQLYQVMTSGKNYKKRELYDQKGTLIHSRETIRNTALPQTIRHYIGREYNGWLLKRDLAVKTISRNGTQSRYYKLTLQNGKEKKRLRMELNEQGEIYAPIARN